MDAVVRNWVALVAEGRGEGPYRWGSKVLYRTNFFYVDAILVVSTNSELIEGEFDTLAGMFNRVGIQTHVRNKVGMLGRPCLVLGNQS